MLLDLKILNGDMSPKFDKYNNTYSVLIEKDVYSLDIDFKLSDGYNLNIVGNSNLAEGDNYIYLEVYNEKKLNTYTLKVRKERLEKVFTYQEIGETLEVKEELPEYVAPLIASSCLLIILILFLLLFKKKIKS